MNMNLIPEEYQPNRADDVRKELDGKISTLQQEMSKKISMDVLGWWTASLAAIMTAVIGYAFYKIDNQSDKINQVNERLVRIETKLDSLSSQDNRKS